MKKPALYLMMGYPGSGKTTVAKIVSEATGAVHLWSDIERHLMFGHPTHSEKESVKLYDELNRRTEKLLGDGKSVVFDTSFNFRSDRYKLKEIADRQGAVTVVLWVTMPLGEAKRRSVGAGRRRNGYHTRMTEEHFDELVSKLEPPAEDENVIKINGLELDRDTVLALIGQHDAHQTPHK
jgi:predicted kinase